MEISQTLVDSWTPSIHNFCTVNAMVRSPENIQRPQAYLNILPDMLTAISTRAVPRDKWEVSVTRWLAVARSAKLGNGFVFGDNVARQFFLESSILYPQHIKHMRDEFWKDLVELNDFGEFAFEESTAPSPGSCFSRRVVRNGKSNVYKIIHNYMLFEQEAETMDNGFTDFGMLAVCWTCRIPVKELLDNAVEVFKRLHRINYSLYRYEYIIKRGRCR